MRKKKLFLILITCILILFSYLPSSVATIQDEMSLYAPVALLMEKNTGKIIYEKNMNERVYPASTTKIMTAILTLEHCNLNDIAKVSYNAVFSVPSGYTNAALQVDEELTIENLLYVLLLPSANDAANVLAEHIAGSVESFATMMNTKALELGCTGTNFTNPSGIHDENHYSTAYDLALIGKYAMQFDTFNKIVKTTSYTLPTTNKYTKTDRIFALTNSLLKPSFKNYYYEYATGLKTGYTNPAKDCIVASAKKNNLEFIAVILNCPISGTGLHQKYLDCKTLFNYGFDNYTLKQIAFQDSAIDNITIPKATSETKNLSLIVKNDIHAFVSNENLEISPEITIQYNKELTAPIAKDEEIGTVTYKIDGIEYTSPILAGSDVNRSSTIKTIFRILLIIFILLLFYTIFGNRKKRKGNYRKSKKSKKIHRLF